MKKITVVIPNFNGMQYVERCLDSLERQTFSDFDVIFVDNGSVDGSRELTEKIPMGEGDRAGGKHRVL